MLINYLCSTNFLLKEYFYNIISINITLLTCARWRAQVTSEEEERADPFRSIGTRGRAGDRDRNGSVQTMRPCATRRAVSGRVVTDPIITL